MEQSQVVSSGKSLSISNCTAWQWQLPLNVLIFESIDIFQASHNTAIHGLAVGQSDAMPCYDRV